MQITHFIASSIKQLVCLPLFLMAFAAHGQITVDEDQTIDFHESPRGKGDTYVTKIDGQFAFQRDDSTFALGVYDYIGRFSGEGYRVKIGDQCGFVDNEGNLIVPVEYDFMYRRVANYITVKKNNKEGLYNYAGELVFACEYDKIKTSPKNGILLIKDGKMGLYSNKNGGEILPIQYDLIEGFNTSGLNKKHYLVTNNNKLGVVTSGGTVVPIDFDKIHENNGLIVVQSGDLIGLYLLEGGELLPATYSRIYFTANKRSNIAIAEKGGKLGIVDNEGKQYLMGEINAIRYIQNSEYLVSPFTPNKSKLFLRVQGENGQWGVFDEYNRAFVVPVEYDAIVQKVDLTGSSYFIVQKGKKMGVVDAENHIWIPFEYDFLEFDRMRATSKNSESDITIVAKKKKAYGLINLANETLIPFEYEHLSKISFKDIYKAKTKAGYTLINSRYEFLNLDSFDQIGDFKNGTALTFKGDSMRQINESCQLISEAKFMHYHQGFRTFEDLKQALIKSLNSKDDELLLDFAEKITPSKHILFLFSKITHTYAYVEYLSPKTISKRYYEVLIDIKKRWNGPDYDQNKLIAIDDYTVFEGLVYTNQRTEETTFGMRKLEWILRDAARMDGYWVSTFFLKHSFK